jgi:hypothetical protein
MGRPDEVPELETEAPVAMLVSGASASTTVRITSRTVSSERSIFT